MVIIVDDVTRIIVKMDKIVLSLPWSILFDFCFMSPIFKIYRDLRFNKTFYILHPEFGHCSVRLHSVCNGFRFRVSNIINDSIVDVVDGKEAVDLILKFGL